MALNSRRIKKVIILAVLLFAFVALLLTMQLTAKAIRRPPRVEIFEVQIATLESALKNAKSEEERESLKKQLELFYQMGTLVTTLQPSEMSNDRLAATKQALNTQLPRTLQVALTRIADQAPTGINENPVHASFLPNKFIVGNAWRNELAGKVYIIYVGSNDIDPEQGAVVVVIPEDFDVSMYLTPSRNGIVRIVDVKNGTLVLQTEKGMIFYFNILGRKFTSSLVEVVPTITPVIFISSPTLSDSIPYP